jgi:DNA processing protein
MPTPSPETAALVALLRIGQRPWSIYADLVEEAGSVKMILEQELIGGKTGQTSFLAPDPEPLLRQAAADIATWTAGGIRLLTVLDQAYPRNLQAVHDRPPLIFVAGELLPRDSRSIAVIGTRQASPRGLAGARTLGHHFVTAGFTVVSGLAAGIDTVAHTSALEADGRTVAVIGTGLHHAYPRQNAALQRRIAQRGAVVSQFWPHASPEREAFRLRNATMSGLALGTVIVEAPQASGARVQARRALAHGRPVFLARATQAEPWARDLAERPGVFIFDTPDEILATLERLQSTGTLTE